MASITNLNHTPPIPNTKHDFVEAIKRAQLHDNQNYTLEKLNPVSFLYNAQTANYINLVSSPYIIAKNIYSLSTKKIESTFIKYELKTQAAIHLMNFINISLQVGLLLSFLGIFTAQVSFFSPLIILFAAISSLIGISQSCYYLTQQNKFLKHFDFECLNVIIKVKRSLKNTNPKDLEKNLKILLNKLYPKKAINPSLINRLEFCCSQKKLSKENLLDLKKLITEILSSYLLDSFNKLKERYCAFTESEQQEQLKKALELYNTLPANQAFAKSLKIIESGFLRKKLNLTAKIHSKLTLQTIENINQAIGGILKSIKDGRSPDLATFHLRKIQKNAEIKKKVLISNIFLYSMDLILVLLSSFFPLNVVGTATMIAISNGISWLNDLDIYGNLETTKHKIDLYNCLPDWAQWIHKKICGEKKVQPLLPSKFQLYRSPKAV